MEKNNKFYIDCNGKKYKKGDDIILDYGTKHSQEVVFDSVDINSLYANVYNERINRIMWVMNYRLHKQPRIS